MSSSTDSSPTPSRQPMQTISEASLANAMAADRAKRTVPTAAKDPTYAQTRGKVTNKAGKAILSGSGYADVRTRQGVEQKAESEQRYIQQTATVSDAVASLDEQRKNTLPSYLGGMSQINIDNLKKNIAGGAKPVQILSDNGKLITVGAIDASGRYSGQTGYEEAARAGFKESGDVVGVSPMLSQMDADEKARDERSDASTAQSVAAEEEKKKTLLSGVTQEGRGRGTRGKRFGGAGTILEGTGALYD